MSWPAAALKIARPSDARRLALLSRQLIEADLPWSWTPPRVDALLTDPSTNAYLAIVDEQLAGFSIATLATRQAHLVLLAVLPEYHRQGVGTALIQWQIKTSVTAGISCLNLEVRARNREARLFYQRLGFRFVCNLPRYYSRREDAVRMSLTPLGRALRVGHTPAD